MSYSLDTCRTCYALDAIAYREASSRDHRTHLALRHTIPIRRRPVECNSIRRVPRTEKRKSHARSGTTAPIDTRSRSHTTSSTYVLQLEHSDCPPFERASPRPHTRTTGSKAHTRCEGSSGSIRPTCAGATGINRFTSRYAQIARAGIYLMARVQPRSKHNARRSKNLDEGEEYEGRTLSRLCKRTSTRTPKTGSIAWQTKVIITWLCHL